MKLYTKEDFLKAAEFCEVSMIDARYIIERIDEVTDPIELPSDEEIEEKLNVAYGNGYEQGEMDFYKKMQEKGNEYADGYAEGYQRALDYMTDTLKNKIEIQGGNNEQQ